ncbi:hypothetical protein Pst134EB_001966 [Puccinia striiformis f. sp. tritici]|nr:hypothetical protein Pst134EB_001966 [Puccinia striiformis f. sp. tritici]
MDAPLMMIWIATISIISFSFSTASPLNRRPLCSLGGGASHFYSALRPVSVELPKSQMTAAADFARPRPLPRKPLTRLKSSRLKPSRRNSAAVSKLKISQLSRDPSVTKIEEIRDVPYTSRQAQTNSEKNIEPPSQAEAPHNQESLGSFERLKDIPKNQNWCRALGQFFKRIKSKFVNLFELLLMNIKRTFRNSHAPSQSEAQSAGEVQTNAAYTEPEGAVQELLAPSKPETSGKEVPAFHQTTTSDGGYLCLAVVEPDYVNIVHPPHSLIADTTWVEVGDPTILCLQLFLRPSQIPYAWSFDSIILAES